MVEELFRKLKNYPGFIYKLGMEYHFMGRWLCKPCTEQDATDSCEMYLIFDHKEPNQDAALYFGKLRAYSDFALEVPCNPAASEAGIKAVLEGLSESELKDLALQVADYEACYTMYSGALPKLK